MKVFISIINFNGRKNTLDCLSSIRALEKNNFDLEVIVVDNGSEEKFDLSKDSSATLLRSERNLGFSGGHNKAVKYALENGADYILILNNDTVVDKRVLLELLETAEKEKDAGIIAPKIYFYKGFEFHKDRYKEQERGHVIWFAGGKMDWQNVIGRHIGVDEVDKGQFDRSGETDFASGACMLVKRKVFEKTGIFDDRYFLYYEDNDLCIRAKKKGFKVFYEPGAILWHKNASSSGGSGSELQDYYISRNRMMFGLRFAPLRSKLALLKESIKILLAGRTWQRRGILDFYLGRLGKGSYG